MGMSTAATGGEQKGEGLVQTASRAPETRSTVWEENNDGSLNFDGVDVKSKWLPWRRLLFSVKAPFAESQLSSLATLENSFHTFEFSICQAVKKGIKCCVVSVGVCVCLASSNGD